MLKSEQLKTHPEMRGRERFKATLRVSEYWKGDRRETVTLYHLAPTMDCMGTELLVGKEYLIYAYLEGARDVRPDADFFFYGWTDVLPSGTPMLQPLTLLGGDLSDPIVRSGMRELGRGKKPAK